jgi:hypothetical protein
MFGKAAITITHGQRVLPARALELGHSFRLPKLNDALADLVRRAGTGPEQGPRAPAVQPDSHVNRLRWASR